MIEETLLKEIVGSLGKQEVRGSQKFEQYIDHDNHEHRGFSHLQNRNVYSIRAKLIRIHVWSFWK